MSLVSKKAKDFSAPIKKFYKKSMPQENDRNQWSRVTTTHIFKSFVSLSSLKNTFPKSNNPDGVNE